MSRTQYVMELETVRRNLIRMGETAVSLLAEALRAVVEPDPAQLEKASELEAQTDHQHRLIHDECLSLITRQAPVARDARLITGVLDAIVDLELIGDYAYEIVTLSSSMRRRPPLQVLSQVAEIGSRIQEVMTAAIDSWHGDSPAASSARPREIALKAECQAVYDKISRLTSLPGDATSYVDLMLVSRHLERILRHAVCVGEQAADAVSPREVLREA
jgi:phosphate transport system protein